MSGALPFDAKNADDFEQVTRRLQEALKNIQSDSRQSCSVANLARLAGVHRNTIYNRSSASSPDEDPQKGWPLSVLADLKSAKCKGAKVQVASPSEDTLEMRLSRLEAKLELSRRTSGMWFQRTLALKEERAEALRQVQILLEAAEISRAEIERLRQMVRKSMGAVKK